MIISNKNAFSKASYERSFLGEVYQKKSDDEAHLETFLKDSNEDVNKVNQMMSYNECRLSHCALTHDKKALVRSRIFAVIQPHAYERRELVPRKEIYRYLIVSKVHIYLNSAGGF